MLGFPDFLIFLGYVFTFLSALFCVVYGIIRWGSGSEEKYGDYKEEIRWEKEEIELIEKLP
jgi:Na+-transporting methylmalonyl-CoA/oxaloacetate decarboxylase gamma subunit